MVASLDDELANLQYASSRTSESLKDAPRPCAILFVVAMTLVHDERPLVMPNWRTFIVEMDSSFRIGRECAESRTFRKTKSNYLLEAFVY